MGFYYTYGACPCLIVIIIYKIITLYLQIGVPGSAGFEFGGTWMLSMKKGDTLRLKIDGMGILYTASNKKLSKIFTVKFIGMI